MRRATKITAGLLGVFAGFGGPEHGYFELLQGSAEPNGLLITSMGPPCVPSQVWHACEPAMTVLPTYSLTGAAAALVGLITMVWAAAFVQRRSGGLVLLLLSGLLLFVGGGLFPPFIGIVAGLLGTQIHKPIARNTSRLAAALGRVWPGSLVAFFTFIFGLPVLGHFYNDLVVQTGVAFPLVIVALLILAVLSATAHDAVNPTEGLEE